MLAAQHRAEKVQHEPARPSSWATGAGKSSFVEFTLALLMPRSLYVNRDEIAKQRWPADPATHGSDLRRQWAAKVLEAVRGSVERHATVDHVVL